MEFVMLVGIPGSGKSSACRQYAQAGYRIHSSDALREAMFGSEDVQRDPNLVFEHLLRDLRRDLEAGVSCVMDATNLSRKRRISTLNALPKGVEQKTCVLVLTSPDECRRRNSQRRRKVPEEVIHRMLCSFEAPYDYEGWDRIVSFVSGEEYRFPREEAMLFSQDNPFHSLTLGAHLEAAREYCRVHSFSDAVREAAWYHDTGKLYTKRFANRRGEPTEIAHYYGHENYSAYLYLCEKAPAAAEAGTWADTLYIANLINWHMRPLVQWGQSPKTEERDRLLLGEKMYEEILQLHQADVAAHGGEKTDE